ncbi:alpha/beta fold hydrolase [Lysobacter sp. GX 14042]|uniref:YheT family hydrolase n=1 Tax=Lysobacter sp. GX 14042 TaxID=2907155 RepID=UPI001F16AF6A|nr:alpha/beta fold hydrolase [Lysobacter sp. GX 14042]MCE7032283.1 alpha/beta fold hydrolase [Lysobacter sp. GX 14042]
MTAADFLPPVWLRNRHLQTVLGSSPLRGRRGARQLLEMAPRTRELILDGGGGVRLLGLHSVPARGQPHGLVLLLHGWEGSAESTYMRLAAAKLLQAGYEVFRLNFRDHGATHELNEGLFHSNLIDEVVGAARDLANRLGSGPMAVGGYSLGGNFALRLALRAPAAGLALSQVAVVCPLLDPARTMDAMEQGFPPYLRHFENRWRASLRRKRELYPQLHGFDDRVLAQRMRELTRWLVERNTDFGTLDRYFDGYSIAGGRLAGLQVPASLLTAADDPVIPVEDFADLELPPGCRLEISPWGGHCGFVEDAALNGFGERWMADRLARTPAA